MPTQDRVRSDDTVTTQCAGQPPHERGEHGPVRPIQARTRVGAMQDGDLVTQHEELDVLGGGRAAISRTSPNTCEKIKYSNVRHEALLGRMEVRDLRCSAVVAVG